MELIIQPNAFLRFHKTVVVQCLLTCLLSWMLPQTWESNAFCWFWSGKTKQKDMHKGFLLHISEWMFWNHSCKSLCNTPSLGGKLQTDVTVTVDVTNGNTRNTKQFWACKLLSNILGDWRVVLSPLWMHRPVSADCESKPAWLQGYFPFFPHAHPSTLISHLHFPSILFWLQKGGFHYHDNSQRDILTNVLLNFQVILQKNAF